MDIIPYLNTGIDKDFNVNQNNFDTNLNINLYANFDIKYRFIN